LRHHRAAAAVRCAEEIIGAATVLRDRLGLF